MDEDEVERRVRERISEIVEARSAKLKASYQQQALKAIQEAESRGYSKGRLEGGSGDSTSLPLMTASGRSKESLDLAEQQGYEKGKSKYLDLVKRSEDEAKRYKAIISMLPTIQYKDNDNKEKEESKNLLIKYLIEQVYRDSKKEFSDDDIIGRFKRVLMKSNDSLVEKFKGYNLVDSSTLTTITATTTTTTTSGSDSDERKSLSGSGNDKMTPVVGHNTRIWIPRSLRTFLAYSIPPMRHVISTTMPSFTTCTKTTKGVFIDGMEEVVMYEIWSKIFRAVDMISLYSTHTSSSKHKSHNHKSSNHKRSNSNEELLCFDFNSQHRYSEFKTLFNDLMAEYPYCIIPSVPDVDILLLRPDLCIQEDSSKEGREAVTKKSKCNYRQLVLGHWLSHLVRHNALQKSHILHTFLGRDLTNRESGRASIKPYYPSDNGVDTSIPNIDVWSPLLDLIEHPTTTTALSVDKVVQMRGCVEIALQDMDHLYNDIDASEAALDSMSHSVREMHQVLASYINKNTKMGGLLKQVSHQESSSCALLMGVDTLSWGYVGHSLSKGSIDSPVNDGSATATEGGVLTPLVHFNSTLSYFKHVNKTAKQYISSFRSSIASTRGDSLLGSMYDGTEGKEDNDDNMDGYDDHDSPTGDGNGNDGNGNDNDMFSDLQRKKLLLASQASKEWEICRRVRSAHTMEALQSLSGSMVTAYESQTSMWLQCLEELDALEAPPMGHSEDAMGATGTEGRGSFHTGNMSILSDVVQADGNALESRKCALEDHISTVQHLQDIQRDVQNQLQHIADTGTTSGNVGTGVPIGGGADGADGVKYREGEMEHANIARAIIPAGLRRQSQQVLNFFFRSTLPPPPADASSGSNDGSSNHQHSDGTNNNITSVGRTSPSPLEEHRGSPDLFASSFGGAGSRMRGWSELSFEGCDAEDHSGNHHNSSNSNTGNMNGSGSKDSNDSHGNGGNMNDSNDSNDHGRERADTPHESLFSSSQQDRLFDFDDDHSINTSNTRNTSNNGHTRNSGNSNGGNDDVPIEDLADTPMNRILKQKARERELAQQREDAVSAQAKAVFSENAMDFMHEKRRRGARGKTARHVGAKAGGLASKGAKARGVNVGEMGWGEAPKPAEARRPVNHTQLAAQLAREQFQQQEHMHWKDGSNSNANSGHTHTSGTHTSNTNTSSRTSGQTSSTTTSAGGSPRKGAHTTSNTSTSTSASVPTNTAKTTPPKPEAPENPTATNTDTTGTTATNGTNNSNSNSDSTLHNTGNDEAADGLPEGWQQVVNDDGSVYYYHKVDRISRWELPTREVAEAHANRHRAEEKEMKEKLQARKAEFLQQQQLEQQENERKQDLQKSIQAKIKKWSYKANDKPKSIGVLLSTLHEICDFIDITTILSQNNDSSGRLNDNSGFTEVKRAYMKALRFIHPDKLPATLSLDQKLLAEATFIYLNEFYENYKSVMKA